MILPLKGQMSVTNLIEHLPSTEALPSNDQSWAKRSLLTETSSKTARSGFRSRLGMDQQRHGMAADAIVDAKPHSSRTCLEMDSMFLWTRCVGSRVVAWQPVTWERPHA